EPYSTLDQRSTYQTMRNVTGRALRLLRSRLAALPGGIAKLARDLLRRDRDIHRAYEWMIEGRITPRRSRMHGNLHPAPILYAGKDFVIIDFEGHRGKPLSERRRKRAPLRDVATLMRSFHYAAFTAIVDGEGVRESDRPLAEAYGLSWYRWVTAALLRG